MSRSAWLIIFFITGFTTFVYEIVWTKSLQTIIGSTVFAASTIIAALLCGFALGSYFAGKNLSKFKNVKKFFSLLQFGVGIYGLVLIVVFQFLPQIYSSLLPQAGFFVFELLIAFALMIVPALFIGATWPAANKDYAKNEKELSQDSGELYFSNAFGSSIGALSAGFVLIPFFGLAFSAGIMAFLNLGISAFLFVEGGRK